MVYFEIHLYPETYVIVYIQSPESRFITTSACILIVSIVQCEATANASVFEFYNLSLCVAVKKAAMQLI